MKRVSLLALLFFAHSAQAEVQVGGGAEAVAEAFPSRISGVDGFALVTPQISFLSENAFELHLSAGLRLRAVDFPPDDRSGDIGGVLRREDWDTLSDFGQILETLRIGRTGDPFALKAGAFDTLRFGRGHLVNRFGNRDDANQHPAGLTASLSSSIGQVSVLASDLLAVRLFALEAMLDVGSVLSAKPDFIHVALSAARDFGGGQALVTPPLTVLQLDADVTLYRNPNFAWVLLAGGGARVDPEALGAGALVGMSIDAAVGAGRLSVRAEGRRQGGTFRTAVFGAGYELTRLSAVGTTAQPVALERLPDAFSGAGEIQLVLNGSHSEWELLTSFGGEYFGFGRLDLDAALTWTALRSGWSITGRMIGMGYGQNARTLVRGEARVRLGPSFYVVGLAGTPFLSQPNGTLRMGVEAGLGVGVDFASSAR